MKIAFLTMMPSPYVQDVFRALSADPRCEVSVFYLDHEADNTSWGRSEMPEYARVVPGTWFRFGGARIHFNSSAIRELRNSNADVYVVGGYPGLTNQAVMYWLKCSRRPWVFWGELPGMRSLGSFASGLRQLAQLPIRSANAIAAVGTRAVHSYRQLLNGAVDRIPVFDVPYHCATEAFTKAATIRPLRETDEVRFLFCGQLIERKGVDLLLTAFLKLREYHDNVRLDLVGTGPLEGELKQRVPSEFADSVIFHGFRPVAELPTFFARADVFVLPSRHDGWGVVVNQAVASRLPVIATSAVGAAHDLVVDGVSGFVVEPNSEDSLKQAMERFVTDPHLARRFGEQSYQFSCRIGLKRAVEDWMGVCSEALRQRKGASRMLLTTSLTHRVRLR